MTTIVLSVYCICGFLFFTVSRVHLNATNSQCTIKNMKSIIAPTMHNLLDRAYTCQLFLFVGLGTDMRCKYKISLQTMPPRKFYGGRFV